MSSLAVFGSSRGIGRSFVNSVVDKYEHIYLFDISDTILTLCDEIKAKGVKCDAYILDVADIASMERCFTNAFEIGTVDDVCYFVRNKNKPHFKKITPKEWDNELNITLKGAFFVVQKISSYLTPNASIVFVSSICAKLIGSETVSYHVAKAGIENLTKYLAKNLDQSIRVNAVRLGFIIQEEHLTKFYSDENRGYRDVAVSCHPIGRVGHVDDVINAMNFLLSPGSSFITGHILNVDGGLDLSEPSNMMLKRWENEN